MGLLFKLLPAMGALVLASALVMLSTRGSLYAWTGVAGSLLFAGALGVPENAAAHAHADDL